FLFGSGHARPDGPRRGVQRRGRPRNGRIRRLDHADAERGPALRQTDPHLLAHLGLVPRLRGERVHGPSPVRALRHPPCPEAKRWYWGFYIGMALATLTKGPVGVLVPLLAVIPYLLLTGRWREVARECRLLPGTAVFLLIAAPWYAAMFLLHGAGYVESARGDTLSRFSSVIGGHGGTILFYFPILFLGFFPWSGFLPAALVQSLRERDEDPQR